MYGNQGIDGKNANNFFTFIIASGPMQIFGVLNAWYGRVLLCFTWKTALAVELSEGMVVRCTTRRLVITSAFPAGRVQHEAVHSTSSCTSCLLPVRKAATGLCSDSAESFNLVLHVKGHIFPQSSTTTLSFIHMP